MRLIPKKFMLGGMTYTVEQQNYIGSNFAGHCSPSTGSIKLAKMSSGEPFCNDYVEQSFYHELVHAVLNSCGESDLSNNETFVDKFAILLHQALKTSEYEITIEEIGEETC